MLLFAVVIFGLSTASLATCSLEGQTFTQGNTFAVGTKGSVSLGAITGCYLQFLAIHAHISNVSSGAVEVAVNSSNTVKTWGQWLSVSGVTGDKDDINENGMVLATALSASGIVTFASGLPGVKESLTVTYRYTATLN